MRYIIAQNLDYNYVAISPKLYNQSIIKMSKNGLNLLPLISFLSLWTFCFISPSKCLLCPLIAELFRAEWESLNSFIYFLPWFLLKNGAKLWASTATAQSWLVSNSEGFNRKEPHLRGATLNAVHACALSSPWARLSCGRPGSRRWTGRRTHVMTWRRVGGA